MQKSRTPLTIGWEAAKANAVPGLILQGAMLAILIAYYASGTVAHALDRLAQYKQQHGIAFVIGAGMVAGAILPELFVIFFFQRGKPHAQNLRNLAFTIPTWSIDAILVDFMYRANAFWFGNVVTIPVVLAKILVDQLGYNPFFAAPAEVLVYEWKNDGFSGRQCAGLFVETLSRQDRPDPARHLGGVAPLMAIIYSLPYPLQFPLFSPL
jgi:hypothetical protein